MKDRVRSVQRNWRRSKGLKASAKELELPVGDPEIDSRHIDFTNNEFEQHVFFEGYLFCREFFFDGATFSGWTTFEGAISGWTTFQGTTFSGGATFDGGTFAGGANFFGATSAANTLNVFGFRKDFFDVATIEGLPAALKTLAALQTLLGTILLFLFGLGVRNKFRMK